MSNMEYTCDPNVSAQRVITPDGRFNYNRSFDVRTLPKINGVPVLSDMSLETIGIYSIPHQRMMDSIAGTWRQYGICLKN